MGTSKPPRERGIEDIPGIQPGETERLKQLTFEDGQKVRTVDDLWRWIGRDSNQGIDKLAEQTGMSIPRIVELLVQQAEDEHSPPSKPRPLRRFWMWLMRNWLVVLFIVVLVALYILGSWR